MKHIKRTFVFLLVIIASVMLVGCGEAKTAKQVSNKINKQTQKIVQVLNSLDIAQDDQLDIKDISPISQQNTENNATTTVSKTTKNVDYALVNGEKDRTILPKRLGYYDINNNFIKDKTYKAPRVNNQIFENGNKVVNTTQRNIINTEKVKDFSYEPKYVNSTSQNFSTDNLQNYFAKIQDLYNTCADCICANSECNNCKQELKVACNNCKSLCDKLNDGSITLTEEQISECNDCLNNLNECMNKLNSTKGDLNSLLSTLRPLLNNYYGNFTSLCECYGKIGMCLDTRIDDIKQCTSCVNQLNDIICANGECANGNSTTTQNTTQINKTNSATANKTYSANKINSTKKTGQKKFYAPLKEKILSAMQSLKKTDKSGKNSAMQTKNEVKTNTLTKSEINKKTNQNLNSNTIVPAKNDNNAIQNEVVNQPTLPNAPNPSNNAPINSNVVPTPLNNGINNANPVAPNGMYGYNGYNSNAGYPYGVNGYRNMPNIDTYVNLPRNIDTYHNIYTNIDTYGKNFENEQIENDVTNQDEQVIEEENVLPQVDTIEPKIENNDITSNNEPKVLIQENPQKLDNKTDNKNEEQVIENNENTIKNSDDNITKESKEDNAELDIQNEIVIEKLSTNNPKKPDRIIKRPIEKTSEQPVNAPVINSPLPNPFDPEKIEKEQPEIVENKESGVTEKIDKVDDLEVIEEINKVHNTTESTQQQSNDI